MLIPRFRGNVIKKGDEFVWELVVTMLGNDEEGDVFGSIKSFKTKEEAICDMQRLIKSCMEDISKKHPELGIDTSEYIDIKNNTRRKWDKKDEH